MNSSKTRIGLNRSIVARGLGLIVLVLAMLLPGVAAAQLRVDRTRFEFLVAAGTNPAPQRFTISADGPGGGFFTILATDERIAFEPRSGNVAAAPQTVAIIPTTDDLDPGDYEYLVIVEDQPIAKANIALLQVAIHVYKAGPPGAIVGPEIEASVDEYLDGGAAVREGDPVWLFANAEEGTPPFRFEWRFAADGVAFGPVPGIADGRDSDTLHLPSLTPEQEGFYRCDITNSEGVGSSAVFNLVVDSPPHIAEQPIGGTVSPGATTSLRVRATGSQPLGFLWYHAAPGNPDFSPLDQDERYSGATLAELLVPNITADMAGEYFVVVANGFGEEESTTATLALGGPATPTPTVTPSLPEFTTQPTAYTLATLGQPLTLQAHAEGYPAVAHAWYFALNCGAFLPLEDGGRISGSRTDTLSISALGTEDEGCFKCLATNATGESQSTLAEVELNHAPIIRIQPVEASGYAPETVSLTLAATGSEPIVYTWQKRNTAGQFVPAGGPRVGGQGTDSLFIHDSTVSDSGVYRCLVSNAPGSVFSDEVRLRITDSPGEMQVDTTELRVYAAVGGNAPPRTITVSNAGGRPLYFTAMPTSEGWIANVSTAGVARPRAGTPVTVTWAAEGLAMGAYEGWLTVEEVGGSGQRERIPVMMMVVSPHTVTSLLDDGGPGTLRSILTQANELSGRQTIDFAVAGDIFPATALPALTDSEGVVLDGAGKIRLRGSRLTGFQDGIEVRSANNIVRDLTITEFPGNGVRIAGAAATGNLVVGCAIGFSGQEKAGNRANGILISDQASNNTIGGHEPADQNQISGNSFSGVMLENASRNLLLGNQIGSALDGRGAAMGNGGNGVYILAGASGSLENTLGGASLFDRNLIAANKYFGRTVLALRGARVALATSFSSADAVSFQWFHDGVPVGADAESFTIGAAAPGDSGLYWCTLTNSGGTTTAPPVCVRVVSRLEMALQELLEKFSTLDTDGNGRLTLAEILALRPKLFASSGARPLAEEEDFTALDVDGDGALSVDELVAGLPFKLDAPNFLVTPSSHEFPEGDIDDGVAGTREFTIENLGTAALDLLSTPTLTGDPREWRYTADSGERILPELGVRSLTVASVPAALNARTSYMNVRTDDFLVPLLPVPLTGFGFQTTPELNGTMTQADPRPRTIEEVDVNGDQVFDAGDTRTNINRGK